jgi:transcription antitermination factor NusG
MGSEPGTDKGMPRPDLRWYALVVRPNWAFKVRDRISELGCEQWLPTYKEIVRWSDRKKEIERQLFPGYLFARFNPATDHRILDLAGVTELLPSRMHPIAIADQEIASLKTSVTEKLAEAEVRGPYVAGMKVSVVAGALSGAEGVVIEAAREKVRVVIEMMGRPVRVIIDPANLKKAA